MNKNAIAFFTSMIGGIVVGILIAPMGGKKLRELLFANRNDKEWADRETYNIGELVGEGSTSFSELKEKIRNNH